MKKLLLLLTTLLLVFSCDVAGEVEDAAKKVKQAVEQGAYSGTWTRDSASGAVTLSFSGTEVTRTMMGVQEKANITNDDDNTFTFTWTQLFYGGFWFTYAQAGQSVPAPVTWDWEISADGNTLTLTDPTGSNPQEVYTKQ